MAHRREARAFKLDQPERIITVRELRKVLGVCRSSRNPARNRLIVLLGAELGLRAAEAARMKRSHFYRMDEGKVLVPTAKKRFLVKDKKGKPILDSEGRRQYSYYDWEGWPEIEIDISPELAQEVASHLEALPDSEQYLFPGFGKKKDCLDGKQINNVFQKLCLDAGITRKIEKRKRKGGKRGEGGKGWKGATFKKTGAIKNHPGKVYHCLRHFRAMNLLKSTGNDIDYVSEQLRHSDIEITRQYLTRTIEDRRTLQSGASILGRKQ